MPEPAKFRIADDGGEPEKSGSGTCCHSERAQRAEESLCSVHGEISCGPSGYSAPLGPFGPSVEMTYGLPATFFRWSHLPA